MGQKSSLTTGSPVKSEDLIQIEGLESLREFVPSRFNARTVSDDGTLILYNSYTGAFSCFPQTIRRRVESMLSRKGTRTRLEGLLKYLYEGGFIVERGSNELERMRLLYGQTQYRRDRLELILLASEECNFRCVYCYETFPRGTMEKWVRDAVIRMVERRAPGLNVLALSWFGGEPLLGYEAIEDISRAVVETTQEHGVTYAANMTTNGYLLTPDVFKNLLKWKVTSYQITLDGMPETHDCKRPLKDGGHTFKRIFKNLKAMKSFNDDFVVNLRINFDRQNIPNLDKLMDLLKSQFGEDQRFKLRFYPVGRWGGPNDDKLEVCGLTGDEERQQLELLATAKGLNTETKLQFMQPRTGLGVCYAARPYNLIIGADGKIMKCTIVLDTADYNVMGYITPDGRADINVDKLARWVSPYFEDDETCKKCFYVPVCQGCSCPLERIESNERPCPGEKTKIAKTLKTLWKIHRARGNSTSLRTPPSLPT